MRKSFIIVFVLLVLGGAVLYYNHSQKRNTQVLPPSPTSQINPSSTDTTNWKLYESQRAAYIFNYPSDLSVFAIPGWTGEDPGVWQEVLLTDSQDEGKKTISVSVLVRKEIQYDNPQEWATAEGEREETLKDTMIDRERAVVVEVTHNASPENRLPVLKRIYLIHNGDGYMLQGEAKDSNTLETLNQILTTFKFTP
jgi:hypothetical protein